MQRLQALSELTILIRGAGEMATGTACRLYRSGFHRLLMTEVEHPQAVRRRVSFCEAVYEGIFTVEGVTAVRIDHTAEAPGAWQNRVIPIAVDPENVSRTILNPEVVVDAILAKHNLGTKLTDASLVIGLGPGFSAGVDVHCVIETNRGHDMGRLILHGSAVPDTGIPGEIEGHSVRRVIRAPSQGVFTSNLDIGAMVTEGQVVGSVDGAPVVVGLSGVIRGLIRPGTVVRKGLKIGDVDPRGNPEYCRTISEKARAIAGSVLEAVLMRFNNPAETVGI